MVAALYRLLLVLTAVTVSVVAAFAYPVDSESDNAVARQNGASNVNVSAPHDVESLDELCRRQANALALRLDGECCVVVRRPFVVAGDADRDQLRDWADQIIVPATRILADEYFDTPPDRPITVLLFNEEATYRFQAERLYGDRRVSRFGYYKPGRRTLLVNMSEGAGPLLHELTHALMACDFPDAPPWLAEGMAVLHEAAVIECTGALRADRLPPWRMRLLQNTAHRGALVPLAELLGEADLARRNEAVAYAHAGGLCLFLHQRGALAEVYRMLRDSDNAAADAMQCVTASLHALHGRDLDAELKEWIPQQSLGAY